MPAPASVPGSETNTVPEGRADEGSCWGEWKSRVHVALMLRYHFRMGKSATKLEAASGFTWKSEPGAWSAHGSKGLFLFESRPERMGPEDGVMWMGWHLNQVTHLCVATSFLTEGR